MKFDTIITGGGLSGLISGIKLAEQGQKCAIISSGQSAIHFFSGSFDLLSQLNGQEIKNPLTAMEELPGKHPYSRIGLENIKNLTEEIPELLKRAGLNVNGNSGRNHYVLTPMGKLKPTWLTLDDFTCFENREAIQWEKVVILNFSGFLDFHTLFVQDGIAQLGIQSEIKNIAMKQFETIRRNPSEMRSSYIARVFDQGNTIDEFAQKVNVLSKDAETVILPAVFGLFNKNVAKDLKNKVDKPVILLPAIPPSTPGIRSQILLRQRFQQLGGTYFLGDIVNGGTFRDKHLWAVQTNNHGDIRLEARQFILASGSFFSKGMVATPEKIYDPIFGLDIDGESDRIKWFDDQIFNDQPYMHYGIKTDTNFRALMNGKPIKNLYVAGAALSGANRLKEGSGAGISLLSSLHIARQILKQDDDE